MTMKTTIRALAVATIATTALAGAAIVPLSAFAAGDTDPVVEATMAGTPNPKVQLSQDGYNAMREIRATRVAIFNGDADSAKKFIKLAQTDLDKTKRDEDRIEHKKTGENVSQDWVAIDGQVVLADNFVATPEKTKHVANGNQKIKEGKSHEAIQELKLAEVDVGFTRVLMPLAETQVHVDVAAEQIQSGAYYEANLALKAAEDGLNIETVMLLESPKSATAATTDAKKSAAEKPAQSDETKTN